MENKIKKSILVGSAIFAVSGLVNWFYSSSESSFEGMPAEEMSVEEIQAQYEALKIEIVEKYLEKEELTWQEFQAFVEILNVELTGESLDLPTEKDVILEMAKNAL